jgi:hypothetical protein
MKIFLMLAFGVLDFLELSDSWFPRRAPIEKEKHHE